MPAPRQQRSTQSRRAVPNKSNPTPQPIAVLLVLVQSTTISIKLNQPMQQLVLSGIPQIRNVTQNTLPTSAALSATGDPAWPTLMGLSMPSGQAATDVIQISAYDAALRNTWGGYMPQATLQNPAPPISPFPWSVTADGSAALMLTAHSPVNSITLPPYTQFSSTVGGACNSVVRINEVSFTLNMQGNMNPGDDITWTPTPLTCLADTGAQPTPQTQSAG